MPSAFSGRADLSGISARGGLSVSEVVHKAYVDVTEQGTEAGAATGIGIKLLAVRPHEEPVVFRADHPFLFLISDAQTQTILFIGRLETPR